MATPLNDFAKVLRRIFKFAKYISFTLIVLLVWFIAVRVTEGYAFFRDMHPYAGYGFLVVFGLLFSWLILRPIFKFMKMPVVVRPPELPAPGERKPSDLVRHLQFVERYVTHLLKNPEWEGSPGQVEDVVARTKALRAEAERASQADLEGLVHRVRTLEQEAVGPLLAPLDQKASELIHREAIGVGVATAVSWNGTVDAFIVLWRNCNLVSRLARIYYGRPGARGTLSILRDVSAATLAGAYLQDLTEIAGSAMGGLFGKTFGAFAGPVMEGGINSVATLRIGYVAKARCRSFEEWTPRTRATAFKGAVKEAARFSKTVVSDVVRTVGGGLAKVPGAILGKVADSLGNLFRKKGDPDLAGEPAPEAG